MSSNLFLSCVNLIYLGSYSYANEDDSPRDMILCLYQYKQGIIYGYNESYVFNSEVIKNCTNISQIDIGPLLDSKQFLFNNNLTMNFSAFVRAELTFSLKTVNFKAASRYVLIKTTDVFLHLLLCRISAPNCYKFDITIYFDNEDHDGQILVGLDAEPVRLTCKG